MTHGCARLAVEEGLHFGALDPDVQVRRVGGEDVADDARVVQAECGAGDDEQLVEGRRVARGHPASAVVGVQLPVLLHPREESAGVERVALDLTLGLSHQAADDVWRDGSRGSDARHGVQRGAEPLAARSGVHSRANGGARHSSGDLATHVGAQAGTGAVLLDRAGDGGVEGVHLPRAVNLLDDDVEVAAVAASACSCSCSYSCSCSPLGRGPPVRGSGAGHHPDSRTRPLGAAVGLRRV